MATVYLAQDLKHQRPVAVKVLRSDLAATLGPERFLRESLEGKDVGMLEVGGRSYLGEGPRYPVRFTSVVAFTAH